ncbi:MAG TPA: hypothetical protein VFF06_22275 [Polyangia bacterium]|nr:hypothetical protein [Polyangia bacterium]
MRAAVIAIVISLGTIARAEIESIKLPTTNGAAVWFDYRSMMVNDGHQNVMEFSNERAALAVLLTGATALWPATLARHDSSIIIGTVDGNPGAMERRYCVAYFGAASDGGEATLTLALYRQPQGQESQLLERFTFARAQLESLRRLGGAMWNKQRK